MTTPYTQGPLEWSVTDPEANTTDFGSENFGNGSFTDDGPTANTIGHPKASPIGNAANAEQIADSKWKCKKCGKEFWLSFFDDRRCICGTASIDLRLLETRRCKSDTRPDAKAGLTEQIAKQAAGKPIYSADWMNKT